MLFLKPLAILVLLTVLGCSSEVPTEISFNLDIIEGNTLNTDSNLTANQNDTVTMAITSDEYLRFHLHGYDIERTITPGEPSILEFQATIVGSFPFTVHKAKPNHESTSRADEDSKHDHGGTQTDHHGLNGSIEDEKPTELVLGRIEVHP